MYHFKPSIGAEVSVTAYNGRSRSTAKREADVDGVIVKITSKYVHVRSYADGNVWVAPRSHFA